MPLIIAHKNIELAEREKTALKLWEEVLAPKWDAKDREEANAFFSGKKEKKAARPPRDRA